MLALDHGLTSGPIKGIKNLSNINNLIDDNKQLNHGIIEKLNIFRRKRLIVQLMGLPSIYGGRQNKVRTCSLKRAIYLGATAVSVQINLKSIDLNKALIHIAEIVEQANDYGIPIMFMLNHSDYENADEFIYSIRVCIFRPKELHSKNCRCF